MNEQNLTSNQPQVKTVANNLLRQFEDAISVSESEPLFKRRLTSKDWKTPPPPPKYTIHGLLRAGSMYLLVGDPGSGKTWSALDMAVCVAKGERWLDMFDTTQGTVLIVDEESDDYRLMDRLHRVTKGHLPTETEADLPIIALVSNGADFGSPDWITALSVEIRQTNATFVVIDALADVARGRDENSVKEMLPVLLDIRNVAHATGATIVVIHHTNKNGTFRGTSAIRGAVDMMIYVEKHGDLVEFKTDKERDIKKQTFSADFTYVDATQQVWLSGRENSEPTEKFGRPAKHILTWLRDHDASWLSDMEDNAVICSANSIADAVGKLAESGHIQRVEGGGKGKPVKFGLTEKGALAACKLS